MISRILYTFERGWYRIKANGKLAFIAVVLFVFPLLFILVLEQFYTVAAANIETLEKQQIETLHRSVATALPLLNDRELSLFLIQLQKQEGNINKFRVYQETSTDDLAIFASIDVSEMTRLASSSDFLLRLVKGLPNENYISRTVDSVGRIDQSALYIPTESSGYYIFSEHTRAQTDNLLTSRKQDAYILLSLIFVFLIALAYWINRQADWEKQYRKLNSTLEERDLFSNMIAHEFRTPLTAIKGYASFLQESDTISLEERRYVDTIRESTERLVLLVNDFLEIARIQSGRMAVDSKELDIRAAITKVFDSLEKEARLKELNLIYTPALKPQMLHTDQNRFIQILTNIVSNSIKYTDKGTVEINCEEDRGGIVIRIKDTGMGITATDQKKLFTPFSRVGGVEHTATTGTGLGMWITKQMIELLGGTIAVESIKDVGTHVVLHFKDLTDED